jgi:Family of unknown function (DUF6876)
MNKTNNLTVELEQFHGTENYYKHQFGLIHYTDGIKYLAENAECYWLIDIVASYQLDVAIRNESFQVYKLKVKNEAAELEISDGNENILAEQKIAFTDFPLTAISLWCVGKILMLPGEY